MAFYFGDESSNTKALGNGADLHVRFRRSRPVVRQWW